MDEPMRFFFHVGHPRIYVSTKQWILHDPQKLIPTNINETTVSFTKQVGGKQFVSTPLKKS
jgi:hypothetical protein